MKLSITLRLWRLCNQRNSNRKARNFHICVHMDLIELFQSLIIHDYEKLNIVSFYKLLQNTYNLFSPPFVRKRPLPRYISLSYTIHYLRVFCITGLFLFPVPKLPNLSKRQAVCCYWQLHHDSSWDTTSWCDIS